MATPQATLSETLEVLPVAAISVVDGIIVEANTRALELFRYPPGGLIGEPLECLIPGRFRREHVETRERFAASPSVRPMGTGREMIAQRADGREFPVEVSLAPSQTTGVTVVTATIVDITDKRRKEAELRLRAAQAQAIANLGRHALAGCDKQALALEANTLLEQYTSDEGSCVTSAVSLGFIESVANVLATTAVTRKAQEDLVYRTLHDELTGLPNRRLFVEHVDVWLSNQRCGVVLSIDLRRFAAINNALGFAAGDELLARVAASLGRDAGPDAVVARIGGDEFGVLHATTTRTEAEALATNLALGLRRTFGASPAPELSIGMVMLDCSGAKNDADAVMLSADAAMCRSKLDAGSVVLFDSAMRAEAARWASLERDLIGALADDGLRLAFQPIVALEDRRCLGFEALARWTHPTLGSVPPQEFVAIAEQSGQIIPLGRWVLQEACCQAMSWREDLRVAVNMSPHQIMSGEPFIDDVRGALAASGLDPTRLCLEITETAVMQDLAGALAVCDQLRALGVSLSVDDFGTGWSSLATLHRLPVDVLKVDRSFVGRIDVDADASAIVRAILFLAGEMHLEVIAEGVSTHAQEALLRDWGCHMGQGYLYGRPAAVTHPALEKRHAA